MEIIFPKLKFRRPLIPLDPNKVNTIFIHHPAWENATVEMIHEDVLNDPEKKNWNGFPYNEYIGKDEKVYIGRGDYISSQAANYNSSSYGICVQGNYNIEPAPPDSLLMLTAERVYLAQQRFPKAKIVLPHSARYNTDCPGKNFPMGKLYDFINEVYKEKENPTHVESDHWGDVVYEALKKEFGIRFNEKRFTDNTTRAESMAMCLQIARSLKNYIDKMT